MTRAAEERLSRYLDGEVDALEARRIERWLRTSGQARAHLAALRRVGDELRAISDERRARTRFAVDDVMANLDEAAGKSPRPSARYVSRKWSAVFPAAALAAAASFAAVTYLGPHAVGNGSSCAADTALAPLVLPSFSTNIAAPPTAADRAQNVREGEDAQDGASIESVDFGSKSGSIFMVSSGAEVTPVVWLMDEPSPKSARMKSL